MFKQKLTDRSARSAIQGYQYQFILSIIEILGIEDDSRVTIEGLEDIDIFSPSSDIAIQCKYFEKTTYGPTTFRKPILAMLAAYAAGKRNQFVLHVHFGDGSNIPDHLTLEELKTCLTERKRKPSPKTVLHYKAFEDHELEDFLSRFEIRVGKSFEHQEKIAKEALADRKSTRLNSSHWE